MKLVLISIIIFPFFASLAGYLFQLKQAWPAIAGCIFSLAGGLILSFSTGAGTQTIVEFPGFPAQPFRLQAGFMSSLLVSVVALVSLLIFIYAKGYMAGEKGQRWFWPAISLFLTGMQLLILAGDWILFITGWELMGLTSFLLIGTWHHRKSARHGAVKAFLMTRFTDMALYAGIFIIILTFTSLYIPGSPGEKMTLTASILILIAVMGKSAQVPFQSWLSGAMAGPTPVSALLHSATMVAAGAFLLFRIHPLFTAEALKIIAWAGSITILLAGLTAIMVDDIKQMLAASTSSQLGFMLLALGAGFPGAAITHWIAHAFMKSSLFMGAGVFQQGYGGTDYDSLTGSGKKLKGIFLLFLIAGISLAGIPPMIGYWSKDAILAATFKSQATGMVFMAAVMAGAFFTAIYIGKALSRLWTGEAEKSEIAHKTWMAAGLGMMILIVLAGGFFIEHLIKTGGYEIPKDMLSKVTGLLVSGAGLALGWFWKRTWVPDRIRGFISGNYPVAGGYGKILLEPVVALSLLSARLDRHILNLAMATGNIVLRMLRYMVSIDQLILKMLIRMGDAGIYSGDRSTSADSSIQDSVENIGSLVREGGRRSKKWQSGLVHQELAISIVLIILMVLILTLTYL